MKTPDDYPEQLDPEQYKRTILEKHTLESRKTSTSAGVLFSITSRPHKDGNPKHLFYEAWFNWEGGTLRSSTVIHDDSTRSAVSEFFLDLTGLDHYETITGILNKYYWHREDARLRR